MCYTDSMGKQFNNQHLKTQRKAKEWHAWLSTLKKMYGKFVSSEDEDSRSQQRALKHAKDSAHRADRREGKLECENYEKDYE